MNCENCGIPEGAYESSGYKLTLQFMPQVGERWKRQQRSTVWVCGSACAVQTMAIAAMGLPSHKWPMTLKEFTSQMRAAGKLDFLDVQPRDKPIKQVAENTPKTKIEFCETVLDHVPRFVTLSGAPELTIDGRLKPPRAGGRPAIENPSAATRRKRRQRAKTTQ